MPQPFEDEAQVVSNSAHDGVDLVAEAAFQEVSAQMAVRLAVSDDGFDGGPAPELLPDLAVDAALLPGTLDPVRLRRIVADIALVHINALDFPAGQGLGLLEYLFQGVAVIRISGQRLGVQDELAALGPFVGRR